MNNQADVQARQRYSQATVKTANDLRTIAQSIALPLTPLTLPEIDASVEIISKMIPAGNVPGVILNGLARLSERRPPVQAVQRDIQLLFRGVEQILDKAVYGAFFAGPAAVIWGYQNLLKLAGKSPEDAFPEGTWQFYVEYALREDTARHTNETHGFDSILRQHQIQLHHVDRLSAWAMMAVQTLLQYPKLLENEWRERVYLRLLEAHLKDTPHAKNSTDLYRKWEKMRPYGRKADAGSDSYTVYRRKKFDQFVAQETAQLPNANLRDWWQGVQEAERERLPAYQQQMSILSYLKPTEYAEVRMPISLFEATIGIIHNGNYFFIPLYHPITQQPVDFDFVRTRVAGILNAAPQTGSDLLSDLPHLKRSELSRIFKNLSSRTTVELERFQYAPILLNTALQNRSYPLAEIRQAARGIGSHAMTIFDTGETFVFDQSHIYFDGAWGSALAEIMTNEALSWARYAAMLPPATPDNEHVRSVNITWSSVEHSQVDQAAHIKPEVSAETNRVNVKATLSLRKLFKSRNDLIQLTVNDLLILYRAIHALTYQPSPEVNALLSRTYPNDQQVQAIQAAANALNTHDNPAILIPIDASQASPSDRLYPMSFEVPINDLAFIDLHRQTLDALDAYERGSGDRTTLYAVFDQLQRKYLATLAAFGSVLSHAKAIALSGESASIGTIKLLAHMPKPLQRLLDEIPSKFEILNDIIKGREVFSNVGAVAPTSTLTRFITAKDDNEHKSLAWGIITDANGTMVLTLRDFRPHVAMLLYAGLKPVAQFIVQDYVDSYAAGLDQYIRDLRRVTLASRETRMMRGDQQ